VLERRDGPQRSPAAHVVNARTFEIWRQAGVDMAALLAVAQSPEEAGRAQWVTKLGGEVIGSLPFEHQGDDMLTITPTPLRNLSQHRLEPLLLAGLDSVRYQHRWIGAQQHADQIVVEVESPEGTYSVRTSYLLAADGAGSRVRTWLGIEPIGPSSIENFVTVHFAADLSELTAPNLAVLHFVVDPASGGIFVCHGLRTEWVFMHPFDPDTDPIESFDEERCRSMVLAAMERKVPLEILGTSSWNMSAQIAERYRDGRVFLIGDAAHRFPPTGGLGLNTGVADVHNLLWKIAAVEAGRATESILDTYEVERRPVAQFNSDQSLINAFKLIEIAIEFGFTEDVEASVTAMNDTLADPDRRARVEVAIGNSAIHFDLLGLQLGHSYSGDLVIDDGSEVPVLEEPARDYLPSSRPGARLPHGWLPDGRSTLDLIAPDVPTLLIAAGSDAPTLDPSFPVKVVEVPVEIWSEAFAVDAATALLVRPDQHIAYRGTVAGVEAALRAMFATNAGR
jgi:2-polyprenyl-6-methoxyphenol hydroxylase-like FAD-dependent oxidoreductase